MVCAVEHLAQDLVFGGYLFLFFLTSLSLFFSSLFFLIIFYWHTVSIYASNMGFPEGSILNLFLFFLTQHIFWRVI